MQPVQQIARDIPLLSPLPCSSERPSQEPRQTCAASASSDALNALPQPSPLLRMLPRGVVLVGGLTASRRPDIGLDGAIATPNFGTIVTNGNDLSTVEMPDQSRAELPTPRPIRAEQLENGPPHRNRANAPPVRE